MSQPYGYNAYYGVGGVNQSSWSPLGTASSNNSSATKHYLIDEYAFDPALSAWISGSVAPPPSLTSLTSALRSPSPSIDLSSSASVVNGVNGGSGGATSGVVTPTPTSTRRAVSAEEFTHVTGGSTKKWPRASSLSNAAALLSKSAKAKKSGQVDIEEEISTQNLYKTELCRSFEETGACRYGTKCQFAHGREELRPVLRHPKYKTEVCKTFHTIGTCPYGKRCRFIHSLPGAPIPAGATEVDPSECDDDEVGVNDDDNDTSVNNDNVDNHAGEENDDDDDDDDISSSLSPKSSKGHHSSEIIDSTSGSSHRKQFSKPDPSVWSTQWPTSNPANGKNNSGNNSGNNNNNNQRRNRRPQSSSSSLLTHDTMSVNAATFQPQASAFVAAAAASSGTIFDMPSLSSYNNTPSSTPSPSSSVSSASDISLSSVDQYQPYQAHNLADIFAKQLLFDVPTPPSPVHESASVDESDLSSVYRLSVFSHFL